MSDVSDSAAGPSRASRPIRVVQWTSGIVGASAIRAILDDPRLDLVGLYTYTADKIGQDAGTLVGRAPNGVRATNDIDAIIALKPDCLVYMPHWPDIAELECMLASGINVVTTARLVTGEFYPEDAGARLARAAERGGATLVGTGCNPMHVPTLALSATALCRHVNRISVTESLDCFLYDNGPTWSGYGFGGPPDTETIKTALLEAEPDYLETVALMARAIGVELDDIRLNVSCAVSLRERDLGYMRIAAGTVCGVDATWTGESNGAEVAEFRTQWTLGSTLGHSQEPEWKLTNGYVVRVDGEPNVRLQMSFMPADFDEFDIGTTTAMPAVNAIPGVVAARPGVLSTFDLPVITGRARN
ncbi:MAG TPA: dihydrodipicolinate reductase [Mycobacterium sp.]|nr:dihydrodipicolinate reductase [Mycobacterium sp.]